MVDAEEIAVSEAYKLRYNPIGEEEEEKAFSGLQGCLRFSRKYWDDIANQNPDMGLEDMADVLVSSWEELPLTQQQDFILDYEMESFAELLGPAESNNNLDDGIF